MIGGLVGSMGSGGMSATGGAAGDATAGGGVSSGNISVGFNVPDWNGGGLNIEKLAMIGAGALVLLMLIKRK